MNTRYRDFVMCIAQIEKNIEKIKASEMKPYGLQGMDVTVLVQLSLKKEGYSVSELARVCEMDKAAISRSIRKLKEKGYVHVKEGYGSRITLCKEGREISAFLEKKIDAYIAEAEIDSIEEREAFYTSLHRISQRIEHLVKETEHD